MSAASPGTVAEVTAGARLGGVVPSAVVTVVALEVYGPDSATLTYRTADGGLGERLISVADLAALVSAPTSRWTFDGDGFGAGGRGARASRSRDARGDRGPGRRRRHHHE